MSVGDSDLRIRLGRIRSTRAPKPKSFINQVLRAAKKAGHTPGQTMAGRRSAAYGRSTFGRGRLAYSRSRLFGPTRRVVVKARVIRHKGPAFRSAPLTAHLSYLKRDGVTRSGERAEMFDAGSDRADSAAFAERCKDDRHHFRFIVSPEDAGEMTDLRAFTRDLAKQMETDLGTRLDWVAVDHWNTDNPHVHLLIRGVDGEDGDLVISRDYISQGLRSRAEELVAIELGPKPEHEIRNSLEREVTAERWTRLDREIRLAADETGYIDLRPENSGKSDPEIRRLMVGRLQHLEKMALAAPTLPGEWMVGLEAEQSLRDLGMRGDIIKSMHRAFTERGEARGAADFVIESGQPTSEIIGRLVDRGLHDELTGEAYALIDGTDGRAHHVRFRGLEAFDQAPPIGGVVEVRRFGPAGGPHPTLRFPPMKFQELVILLPCHSLEDFPTHHSGDEAEGLLSAWSSLWHPALLASARSVPNWARADAPPENIAGKLLVCPQVAQELLLAGFAGRCKNDGAVLIRKCTTRQQILEKALAELERLTSRNSSSSPFRRSPPRDPGYKKLEPGQALSEEDFVRAVGSLMR